MSSLIKKHILILIACFSGYFWIYIQQNNLSKQIPIGCLLKTTTNIPCPACGSTRAIQSILNQNYLQALLLNPLGYIVLLLLIIIPPIVLYDIIFHKKIGINIYNKINDLLKQPKLYIPLFVLILLNWIWNINKNL